MTPTTPGPSPRQRIRFRRHACDYRYVRKVNGWKYQARLWVPGHSINLGLYPSDSECHRVITLVLNNLKGNGPLDVWYAMRPLIECGRLPKHLLPKYAVRRADGLYDGCVRKNGRRVTIGPFTDPADATAAMLRTLAALAQSKTPRGN